LGHGFEFLLRHECLSMEEWRCSSTHFLTSALGGGVVSFTTSGKSHRYSLDRRLDGPQNRFGR
jgi:hypothetical protein